jgi:hypothetical protein
MRRRRPVNIDRSAAINDLPFYLTVDELAQYLQIGRSTAYGLMQRYGKKLRSQNRMPRERIPELLLDRAS